MKILAEEENRCLGGGKSIHRNNIATSRKNISSVRPSRGDSSELGLTSTMELISTDLEASEITLDPAEAAEEKSVTLPGDNFLPEAPERRIYPKKETDKYHMIFTTSERD